MVKRYIAFLVFIVIITASSMAVFAGNTEGTGADASGTGMSGITADAEAGAGEETESDKARKEFNDKYINALKDGKALDNGQFIMTITKPENDKDSTYKKSYVISGKSAYDDVVISVARLNRDTGEYELIKNTDGESSWGIGSGVFSTEILLVKGVNNLMFISYRKSEMVAEKIQFNSVTVELLPESLAEKIVKKATDIGNNINKGFDAVKQSVVDIFGGKDK